ncbi:differentially expressed in FDCP 6 homolog [Rhincodon typus]|uniref:differentially expressed in FDCP 6 homolog n=1 Tax=Rhincodon typus TaxID=259920 RepID=UPI00202E82B8|nr:differentially expressed in FDCP 6 homolog [Rhincodon typus]
MDLKNELLKSIWYAFTALDLEQSGKVSKSQLKVLSYNLYTVLNIPHDPKILEDHFRDDNDGPVSSHGYMPYLNKYILDKVQEGHFVKENFHELCWTLTAKKNYKPSRGQGLISESSAFKLWCLFNFLSEDKYPLVMVHEEVGYLLRKVFTATGQEWLHEEELAEYFSQNPSLSGAVTVWQFLEMMESGRFTKPASKESLTLGIQSVYEELVLDVMQQLSLFTLFPSSQVAEQKRRRASQHVKHWNVQLSRLMQPIVPGAAQNPPKSDILSHRGGGAFIPKEFAVRRKDRNARRQHEVVPSLDSEEMPGSDSEDYENMAEYIKNMSLTGAKMIP